MIYRDLLPEGRDLLDATAWRGWTVDGERQATHGRAMDAAFSDLKAGDLRVHVFDRFIAAYHAKGGAR